MDPMNPLVSSEMTDAVLRDIFASDQAMYPAPLTLDRLRGWVNACPELSRCFYRPAPSAPSPPFSEDVEENDGCLTSHATPHGVIIGLPVKEGFWKRLLDGRVKETDIDPGAMFPRAREGGEGGREEGEVAENVGLHVFHVKRFDRSSMAGNFTEKALRGLLDAAAKKGWHVVRFSALTATPEGERAFTRLGFGPTGYEERWVEGKDGHVELATIGPGQSFLEMEDFRIKGKAQMLVRHHV